VQRQRHRGKNADGSEQRQKKSNPPGPLQSTEIRADVSLHFAYACWQHVRSPRTASSVKAPPYMSAVIQVKWGDYAFLRMDWPVECISGSERILPR
jgi:hypothetical protein